MNSMSTLWLARMSESMQRRNPAVAGLLLLLLRGVLLWLVVPVATCTWPVTFVWFRRPRITLGQFLGWSDLNLMALLSRVVLRPFFRAPLPWIPWHAMPHVTHRLRFIDPA